MGIGAAKKKRARQAEKFRHGGRGKEEKAFRGNVECASKSGSEKPVQRRKNEALPNLPYNPTKRGARGAGKPQILFRLDVGIRDFGRDLIKLELVSSLINFRNPRHTPPKISVLTAPPPPLSGLPGLGCMKGYPNDKTPHSVAVARTRASRLSPSDRESFPAGKPTTRNRPKTPPRKRENIPRKASRRVRNKTI